MRNSIINFVNSLPEETFFNLNETSLYDNVIINTHPIMKDVDH